MRYLISPKQIRYFKEHGMIEFLELLSKEEARRAFISCDLLLQKRLNIMPDALVDTPQETLLPVSRDLFREDKYLKKIATRKGFAQIMAELCHVKPLRLAFDLLFYTNEKKHPLFSSPRSLQEMLAIQGICGGLLLRLSFLKKKREVPDPIPKQIGNGLFFKADQLLDLSPIFSLPSQMFYLIGFAEKKSLYFHNKKDPHLNDLKKLGYHYGDLLKDEWHPLLLS